MIAAPPAPDTMTALDDRISDHTERIRRLQATVRALARLPADVPGRPLTDTVRLSAAPTPPEIVWPVRTLPTIDDADLFAAAADVGETAVVGLDIHGTVRFWNAAATELFGWTAAEVLGKSPAFLPADKVVEHAGLVRAIQTRGAVRERPTVRRRNDGSLVPVRVLATPSRCGGVVFAYREVEHAPATESGPLAANFIALGRSAAGVVHDFNNLLSVIQAHSELLCEELPNGGSLGESARAITAAAELAAGVTRNLLGFIRPEQSSPTRVELSLQLSKLDRVIRSVVGAQVKVNSVAGGGVGAAAIDPAALTQIVLNLVVNARDAMPDGGTLHVRTALHSESQVLLTVSDTGHGMDDETRVRVFDPYSATKCDGTGLGLTIVRDAVARAGGRVEVESAPDWGTQVRVYLPRA